ncbi:tail fiber domain-containing protein [Sulfurovum sp. CS9]|uniref:tail fiber domain-containing protein n=1 Tax=Sulfurovum sp. CS9 TaxID=3391146 RepID=UPI0039ECAA6F
MEKKKIVSLAAAIALIGSVSLYGGSENNNTNVYYGEGAGSSLDGTGINNVFIGYEAGQNTTGGEENTFIGRDSGNNNTTGSRNTFSGTWSGGSNLTGDANTFSGNASGAYNTTGWGNTFSGVNVGHFNTTGHSNTFSGSESGTFNTSGIQNTFSGFASGFNANVNKSVFLGFHAGYNATRDNTLYISNTDTESPLIYGEFDNDLLRINGTFEVNGTIENNDTITSIWSGSHEVGDGLTNLVTLSADNTDGITSDAGFSIKNARAGFRWSFRTGEPNEGFIATKIGTGGAEFELRNTDTSYTNVSMALGNGATCTSTGQWVDASSRDYKENIKTLDTQTAMEAFKQLNPVTFNFKRDEGKELMTGFIAEDVPELVATEDRKGISSLEIVALLTKVVKEQEKVMVETRAELKAKDERIVAMEARQKAQDEKIANLEAMQKKVAQLESILTNLALDTSNISKKKISMK